MVASNAERQLARTIARLQRETRTQARASQAARRSVELVDGPVTYYGEDGEPALEIGPTEDGAFTVVERDTTPMPVPTPPSITQRPGAIVVLYDGTFEDANTPSNLAYFEIHASQAQGYFADDSTQIGTFTSINGGSFVFPSDYEDGDWYISLQAVSKSGVESDKSIEVVGRGGAYPLGEPVAPPDESPAVQAYGSADSIIIETGNVPVGASIEYYISDVDGFFPDSSTLYTTSQSTVLVTNTLPNGTPLDPTKTYFVQVWATNSVDRAPAPSAQIPVRLDSAAVTKAVFASIVTGFILTGKIQVGQALIDANQGIIIPQPDGGTIHFPVDGSFAQITAHLIARSLNIVDNLTISGVTNYLLGQLIAADGVAKPSTPPTPTGVHESMAALNDDLGTTLWKGLVQDASNVDRWIVPFYYAGVSGIRSISKADGSWTGDYPITGMPAILDGFNIKGGVCWDAATNYYYAFGTSTHGAMRPTPSYFMVRFTVGWAYVNHVECPFGESIITQEPRIASDGTYIWAFYYETGKRLASRRFLKDLSTNGTYYATLAAAHAKVFGISGVYIGAADFGATRTVVGLQDELAVVLQGTPAQSMTRLSLEEFSRPSGEVMAGLTWDGTRFWGLSNKGTLWKYSQNKAPAGQNKILPLKTAHAWYDGNGVTHETAIGPVQNFNLPARMFLRIETPAPPDAASTLTDVDKADMVRVYATTDMAGTLHLQATWPPGTRSGTFDTINETTAGPPADDTGFNGTSRTPGRYLSGRTDLNGPIWQYNGDGSGRFGPMQIGSDGKTLTNFGPERPGTIIAWPSGSIPLDCARCDGQAVPRPKTPGSGGVAGDPNSTTDLYRRIFELFGTGYGVGDGVTTFNLPDYRGRILIGVGTYAQFGSSNDGQAESVRGLDHKHTIPGQTALATITQAAAGSVNVVSRGDYSGHNHGGTVNANPKASGDGISYHGIYYIIKLG